MRFLIIDDDASVRTLLKKRLQQKWPGTVVDNYDPVLSGIPDNNFRWINYDVVFLDFDLGIDNLTGLDLLARIKRQENSAKVIMVTGQGSEEIAVQAIRIGATDYLIKYDVVTDRLFDIVTEALNLNENSEDDKSNSDNQIIPVSSHADSKHDQQSTNWHIPGYEYIETIRQGYTSTILANRLENGQRVILKVQNFKNMDSATLLIKRFTRELNILTEISHPNIIQVLDHGVTDNLAYYATEYYDYGDLAHKISQEKITTQQAVDYICQIASGLSVLHKKGIVHRDIKPSNILFKDKNKLVLADLGIAKDLFSDEALTLHGEILGTPYYMSIEQLNGAQVDVRSDIYSLGILFYQLLTNDLPFTGESIMQVVYKHTYELLPKLPDTIAVWQPLIEKMTAKKPEDRYQDLEQFLNDVKNITN